MSTLAPKCTVVLLPAVLDELEAMVVMVVGTVSQLAGEAVPVLKPQVLMPRAEGMPGVGLVMGFM